MVIQWLNIVFLKQLLVFELFLGTIRSLVCWEQDPHTAEGSALMTEEEKGNPALFYRLGFRCS